VLSQVRKAKSEAKVSMRTDVAAVTVRGTPDEIDLLAMAADDLRSAGKIRDLTFDAATEVTGLEVTVTL
jgi:valyl-tRNA synthetase